MAEKMTQMSRTLEDVNQMEVEDLARGAGPHPPADNQLHLNMLRRRIQQQRSMVSKLSRDDLENQHLHALEELEILKRDSNIKDQYIKRLSTKILRLQQNENVNRSAGRDFNDSLRSEMERKVASLENQLKMTKVYGATMVVRKGSKGEQALNRSQSDLLILRQQIQSMESEKREQQEIHQRTVNDLWAELEKAEERLANGEARATMLENIEITRLSRQLQKTAQDLSNLKNDYMEIKPKYDELQINKIIFARENEGLKRDIERNLQTTESLERQLRESREKTLQNIHDQDRAGRLEQELDFFRRQLTGSNQVLSRPAAPTSGSEGAGAKIASDVLREQVKSLENELQREAEEGRELRRRLMDRETEIEKALRDVSELRSGSVLLQQECDEFRRKLETAKSNGPKEEEGWFKVPQGYAPSDLEQAVRLFDGFVKREDISVATDIVEPQSQTFVQLPSSAGMEDQLARFKQEIETINKELRRSRDELHQAREAVAAETAQKNKLQREVSEESNSESRRRKELEQKLLDVQQKLHEKNRQLKQNTRLVESLGRQLEEIANGTLVYNLEEEVADQSRLSADNVVLQHGDNLLQLHFGPLAFNEEFFAQAKALQIERWRLKWSVFGEDMFAQDSHMERPDFDFTAIHCITMDEHIISDLAEGFIRVEIVGSREEFARAFAFATFSCKKLLSDSYQRLNRIRGEASLISQFNVGMEFGIMVYWMRIKFDLQQTQAMYDARQKALAYVEDNLQHQEDHPTADQLWMEDNGDQANLLHITIHNCRNIRSLTQANAPSPCVLYQFYNSRTTYTPTVIASENPDFEHQSTFRVMENDNFHDYLLSNKLELYVTDTNDHNEDHFLGCCRIDLTELIDHPITELRVQLFTKNHRENGYITLSMVWELPYKSHRVTTSGRPPQKPSNAVRLGRASLTPRGSLVSVTHNAKLLKVKKPNDITLINPHRYPLPEKRITRGFETRSGDGNGVEDESEQEYRPKPVPRRNIPRGSHISDRTGGLVNRDSQKGNDYFSPPSTSNHKMMNCYDTGSSRTVDSVVSPRHRRPVLNGLIPKKRSVEGKVGSDEDLRSDSFDPQSTLKRKRSLTLNERRSPARERRIYRSLGRRWSLRESRSGPLRTVSRNRNPSIKSDTMLSLIKRAGNEASHTNNGADAGDSPRRPPQKSRESPNRSARQFKEDFRRSLNNLLNTEAQIGARKHEAEVVERNSVLPPSASAHTIQAQMHHAEALGSVSGTRGTHDPLHPSENARKTSVKSVRKLSDPSVPGRVSENEKRISHTPVDTIVIIVHSVYFVEGGQIINDPRSGEIFVVFRLLDMEYESPLAVVKSAVPHKEMIFEFHKDFPMGGPQNAERRTLALEMLRATPPGRILFSVYFQPDAEDEESELTGVAALSLTRLLNKNQDAVEAELKLVSPTNRAAIVGYVKVTVRALDVLTKLKDEVTLEVPGS